jgi:hypothetical protein
MIDKTQKIELSNIKYGKSKTKDGYNQREKSIGSFRKIL